MRSLRVAAALFVSIAHAGGARADAVDDFIRSNMAREQPPGLVLAIASPKQGEVIRPCGQANLELGLKFYLDAGDALIAIHVEGW